MKYWAVCYAHVCRWEKASTATEAAKLAFGVVASDRMTIRQFPSNPKYMSYKKRQEFLEPLYKRHEEKTGTKIA